MTERKPTAKQLAVLQTLSEPDRFLHGSMWCGPGSESMGRASGPIVMALERNGWVARHRPQISRAGFDSKGRATIRFEPVYTISEAGKAALDAALAARQEGGE